MNKGYFISTNIMVDPSRVYCKKCGAQADKKDGTWFATSEQNKKKESYYGNEKEFHDSFNANFNSLENLCPDCVQIILIEAINKGDN